MQPVDRRGLAEWSARVSDNNQEFQEVKHLSRAEMSESNSRERIQKLVIDFIKENFVFDDNVTIGIEESLLGSGTVDSTGILELIAFVEEAFNLQLDDSELIADNFDSVGRIVEFVSRRQAQEIAASLGR